jgi:tetratricopeptide (TPR) repeat protein
LSRFDLPYTRKDVVPKLDKIRRKKSIRAAEGYLDLAMGLTDRITVDPDLRDRLAKSALDAIAALAPRRQDRSRVHFLRGQALRLMENYRDAVKPLEKAAALEAKNHLIHLALAWCYKRVGRLDLAIQVLDKALDVAPEEAIIHYNLACYWSLAHNTQRALQFLIQSFELEPSLRDVVADEPDFDPIRENPEFRLLTSVVV